MSKEFQIANRWIGEGHACLIIAEAGVNHNGRRDQALRMIDAAKRAGVDAVKFQSFVSEELVTAHAEKADYQKKTTRGNGTQLDMLKALELSKEDHRVLKKHCENQGMIFLSTPFDLPSLSLLESLNVPAYKVSSTDLTNIPFLEEVASKGKPVFLSTGMSYLGEVAEAVTVLRNRLEDQFVVLHCTSNYPAEPEEVNLRAMQTLRGAFACLIGYSDHSRGVGASPYAVAMGAKVIEKHFTLDKTLPGPDHLASVDPAELLQLVRTIREVETILGSMEKRPTDSEQKTRLVVQKSVVARTDIPRGTVLEEKHLMCKRPATGLPPRELKGLLGKVAVCDITKDELLHFSKVRMAEALEAKK